MQWIRFGTGEAVLVGDALAGAVLDYAWLLATYHRHDLVRFPAVTSSGEPADITLLIGPTSHLSTSSAPAATPASGDAAAADELQRRAGVLREGMLEDAGPAVPWHLDPVDGDVG